MITNLVRENRKTLSIMIDRAGEMHIKAPKNYPLKDILEFVKQKQKWISSKQNEIKKVNDNNKDFLEYSKILYLGQAYEPVFARTDKPVLQENLLLVPEKYAGNMKNKLSKWLKERALGVVENRLLYLSSQFNLDFSSVKLINSRVRWGSCDSTKNLAFNWRVIMLPPNLVDYIIVHELAHLKEMNHSKMFWFAVSKMMPNFDTERKKLKQSSFVLELYR